MWSSLLRRRSERLIGITFKNIENNIEHKPSSCAKQTKNTTPKSHNSLLCAICEGKCEVGSQDFSLDSNKTSQTILNCKGKCHRSFHAHCVEAKHNQTNNTDNGVNFICVQCQNNKHHCAICHRQDASTELVHCFQRQCRAIFHRECRKTLFDKSVQQENKKGIECPRHRCWTCLQGQMKSHKKRLLRCIRCIKVYHTHCAPINTFFVEGGLMCASHKPLDSTALLDCSTLPHTRHNCLKVMPWGNGSSVWLSPNNIEYFELPKNITALLQDIYSSNKTSPTLAPSSPEREVEVLTPVAVNTDTSPHVITKASMNEDEKHETTLKTLAPSSPEREVKVLTPIAVNTATSPHIITEVSMNDDEEHETTLKTLAPSSPEPEVEVLTPIDVNIDTSPHVITKVSMNDDEEHETTLKTLSSSSPEREVKVLTPIAVNTATSPNIITKVSMNDDEKHETTLKTLSSSSPESEVDLLMPAAANTDTSPHTITKVSMKDDEEHETTSLTLAPSSPEREVEVLTPIDVNTDTSLHVITKVAMNDDEEHETVSQTLSSSSPEREVKVLTPLTSIAVNTATSPHIITQASINDDEEQTTTLQTLFSSSPEDEVDVLTPIAVNTATSPYVITKVLMNDDEKHETISSVCAENTLKISPINSLSSTVIPLSSSRTRLSRKIAEANAISHDTSASTNTSKRIKLSRSIALKLPVASPQPENTRNDSKPLVIEAKQNSKRRIVKPRKMMKKFDMISKNRYLCPKPALQKAENTHVCQCVSATANCGESCVNRMLLMECDERTCPARERCTNRRLQRREYPKLKLIQTQHRGNGLITRDNLKAGQLVIEYCGEVLDESLYNKRIHEMQVKNVKDFYMLKLGFNRTIDAAKKGSLARFINHSCSPNCHTEKWMVGNETRVGIFASRSISADTELTYDYHFSLFLQKSDGNLQKCYCSAATCSGYLGGRPKKAALHSPTNKKRCKKRRCDILNPMQLYRKHFISQSSFDYNMKQHLAMIEMEISMPESESDKVITGAKQTFEKHTGFARHSALFLPRNRSNGMLKRLNCLKQSRMAGHAKRLLLQ